MAVKARGSRKPSNLTKHNREVAAKILPASKMPRRFRGLFYGKSGRGKTRLAASAPKCLIIDVNEEGTDSVRRDYDPNVFPVKFWQEINDVYWYLQSGDHPYESVAVDGLTGLQELCMKFVLGDEASRDASRDPDMPSKQAWGKTGELMKTQIMNFRNLPMHVIFTALERKSVIGDDEDDDVEVFISPALSPSVAGTAERAVGMIGYLQTRNVVVRARGEEGKKKSTTVRVPKTRLLVAPSERYLSKDRYHIGAPHVDEPNVTAIIQQIYGGRK